MDLLSSPVLLDTSVWVMYLRRRNASTHTVVAQLVQERRVATCGIVLTELVGGEADPLAQERIMSLLEGTHYFEYSKETWFQAGKLSALLRRRGVGLATPDLLIAALALQHNCALYTLDTHFQRIPDLTLYSP